MIRKIWTSGVKSGLFSGNRFFISPIFLLLLASICSCVIVSINKGQNDSLLYAILSDFVQNKAEQSTIFCFLFNIITEIGFIFACFVFGTSSVGTPLLYIILFSYFVFKTSFFSFLYLEYGFLSFVKSLVLLIPQNVFLCFVAITLFQLSLKTSKALFKRDAFKTFDTYSFDFKKYCFSFLICILIILPICFYDALLSNFMDFIISK